MYPLTLTRPKPMLKAANKTLLEHNLDYLNGMVNEAIIVVGYKKEMIKKHLGKNYSGIKLRFAEQKKQLGTGNALLAAENLIKDDFISLYADDLYSKEDVANIQKFEYSILVRKVENPAAFGVIVEKNKMLFDIIEKPQAFISNTVNTGLYKMDRKIFPALKSLKKSLRGEYELTDALRHFASKYEVRCVSSRHWIPIGYPKDLLKADRILRKGKNVIGKNTKIYGDVEDSSIGDNCVVKGTVSGSILMDCTFVDGKSSVTGSIIGENVYIGGTSTNNVIADNVRAVNVDIMDGVKVHPNKNIKGKIMHDVE